MSWGSKGANWSDPNIYTTACLEEIRLGLLERYTALGMTANIPYTLSFPLQENAFGMLLTTRLICSIHQETLKLINRFVNREDSDGDWTGNVRYANYTYYDTIAPSWGLKSFFEYIKEKPILPSSSMSAQRQKKWYKQQKKIISNLQWIKVTVKNTSHWGYWSLYSGDGCRFFNNFSGTFLFDSSTCLTAVAKLPAKHLELTYDYYAPLFRIYEPDLNTTPFSLSIPTLPVSSKTYLFEKLLHNEPLKTTDTYTISERVRKGIEAIEHDSSPMKISGVYSVGFCVFILKYDFSFAE